MHEDAGGQLIGFISRFKVYCNKLVSQVHGINVFNIDFIIFILSALLCTGLHNFASLAYCHELQFAAKLF